MKLCTKAIEEMKQGAGDFRGASVWSFVIRFIAPVIIFLILLSSFL
ncbi:MAG: hypothetical protein ABIL68_07410 [bacterium]